MIGVCFDQTGLRAIALDGLPTDVDHQFLMALAIHS